MLLLGEASGRGAGVLLWEAAGVWLRESPGMRLWEPTGRRRHRLLRVPLWWRWHLGRLRRLLRGLLRRRLGRLRWRDLGCLRCRRLPLQRLHDLGPLGGALVLLFLWGLLYLRLLRVAGLRG